MSLREQALEQALRICLATLQKLAKHDTYMVRETIKAATAAMEGKT